jgi:hypothetical protein|eukprot:2581827-Prymnesium_polylepis.1
MEMSEVRDCVALGDGGALQIFSTAIASIVDCHFTRNRAYKDGGGVHLREAALIYFKGCVFTECTAVHGGGVHISGQAMNTTIDFCTFIRCVKIKALAAASTRELSIAIPCEHCRCSAAYHPLMPLVGFSNSELIIKGGAISAAGTQLTGEQNAAH